MTRRMRRFSSATAVLAFAAVALVGATGVARSMESGGGAEVLDDLKGNIDTLRQMRGDGKGGEFLDVKPEDGTFKTHTSVGEIARWGTGREPGASAREGQPLVYITGEVEGLNTPDGEQSARLLLYRDTPLTGKTRIGMQYLFDWQQNQTSLETASRSTIAPYVGVDLMPGVSVKGTAGYVFDNTATAADATTMDGALLAGELAGKKSWQGFTLGASNEWRHVADLSAERTEVTLKPELSYRFENKAGMVLTPRLGYVSQWIDAAATDTDDQPFSLAPATASAEVGVKLDVRPGVDVDVTVPDVNFDDPEQSDFKSRLSVKLPLH